MKKRIDIAALAPVVGTLYPPPFDEPCRARARTRLGDPAGLTQFGVNLLRLPPGAWSSQRHWHTASDEFVYVLSGEIVLVTDAATKSFTPATPPASRPTTPTATACKTAPGPTPKCSKSAPALPATPAITATST